MTKQAGRQRVSDYQEALNVQIRDFNLIQRDLAFVHQILEKKKIKLAVIFVKRVGSRL